MLGQLLLCIYLRPAEYATTAYTDDFYPLDEKNNTCLEPVAIFGLHTDASCKIHSRMKKYFSERNALTVAVSIFCFVMMLLAIFKEQSLWQAIAFALAFSFSVEVICHRSREKN